METNIPPIIENAGVRELQADELDTASGGKKSGSWFVALAKALGEAANKQASQLERL